MGPFARSAANLTFLRPNEPGDAHLTFSAPEFLQ